MHSSSRLSAPGSTPPRPLVRRGAVGVASTGILHRPCHRGAYVVSHRRDRSGTLIRQGPLAGRYPAVAAMVMSALIPYLALSAALNPLTPIIAKQLHTSLQTMSLSAGLANAAYAVGTVLAVSLPNIYHSAG